MPFDTIGKASPGETVIGHGEVVLKKVESPLPATEVPAAAYSLEKDDRAMEQIGEIREAIDDLKTPSQTAPVVDDDIIHGFSKSKIIEGWKKDEESYKSLVANGVIEEPEILPSWAMKVKVVTRNVAKLANIAASRIGEIFDRKEVQQLKEITPRVRIVSKADFLNDPQYLSSYSTNSDSAEKESLGAFVQQEVMWEKKMGHLLIVEGLSVKQLHGLFRQMEGNPWTFLSGDRGQNGGDIVHDLQPNEMIASEKDHPGESVYWSKLFKYGPFSYARYHALPEEVTNERGEKSIIMTTHIDPKNWVVSIKETWDKLRHPGKVDDHQALSYHAIPNTGDDYWGTGLFEMGVLQTVNMLDKAVEKGIIKGIDINREMISHLKTTGSIVADDEMTWALIDAAKKKEA